MTRSDPSTSTSVDPTRFSVVDHTADPDFYVRFMEQGHRIPDIVTGRMMSTAMLHLRTGHRVLDVGCGPALDAVYLAARIGPRGEPVGVDASAAIARRRVPARRRARYANGVRNRFRLRSPLRGRLLRCLPSRTSVHAPCAT
jgi:SAM-dependent methyltransferase